jgi:hypothetical protein
MYSLQRDTTKPNGDIICEAIDNFKGVLGDLKSEIKEDIFETHSHGVRSIGGQFHEEVCCWNLVRIQLLSF